MESVWGFFVCSSGFFSSRLQVLTPNRAAATQAIGLHVLRFNSHPQVEHWFSTPEPRQQARRDVVALNNVNGDVTHRGLG